MFENCRLELIQNSNKPPGADPVNEKRLEVRLHREALENLLSKQRIYEWLSEGFTVWGQYKTYKDGYLSDGNIGPYDRKTSKKVWRYNPGLMTLNLATWESSVGGGGLPHGATTDRVMDDVVLKNAIAHGAKVRPFSNQSYDRGDVIFNRASANGLFRSGEIYWEPL